MLHARDIEGGCSLCLFQKILKAFTIVMINPRVRRSRCANAPEDGISILVYCPSRIAEEPTMGVAVLRHTFRAYKAFNMAIGRTLAANISLNHAIRRPCPVTICAKVVPMYRHTRHVREIIKVIWDTSAIADHDEFVGIEKTHPLIAANGTDNAILLSA